RVENLISRLQVPVANRGQWPAPPPLAGRSQFDQHLWQRSVPPGPIPYPPIPGPTAVKPDVVHSPGVAQPQTFVRQEALDQPTLQPAVDGKMSPEPQNGTNDTAGGPWPGPQALKAIQLYDSYLVLETEDGMLVIDQHALHERILFEQLKERIRNGN